MMGALRRVSHAEGTRQIDPWKDSVPAVCVRKSKRSQMCKGRGRGVRKTTQECVWGVGGGVGPELVLLEHRREAGTERRDTWVRLALKPVSVHSLCVCMCTDLPLSSKEKKTLSDSSLSSQSLESTQYHLWRFDGWTDR